MRVDGVAYRSIWVDPDDGWSIRIIDQTKLPWAFEILRLTDLAQVRYLKVLRQGIGADERFSHWVATVQYAYGEPAKDPKTRRWNPLGFKIVDFKSEPEVAVDESADKDRRHDS